MSRQPPAASPRATSQSGGASEADGPATASTSAAATSSGRWLIPATARSWVAASSRTTRARQASASPRHQADVRRVGRRARGRRPTADRRTGRRGSPRTRSTSSPAIGWPPTKRRPAASARADEGRLRARDVGDDRVRRAGLRATVRPGRRAPRDRRSAGPASTTRSAPASASGAEPAARSMTPSAAAWLGPAPEGDHALIVHDATAWFARTARAIEPPISPKPMKPRCIGRVSQPSPRRCAEAAGRAP